MPARKYIVQKKNVTEKQVFEYRENRVERETEYTKPKETRRNFTEILGYLLI